MRRQLTIVIIFACLMAMVVSGWPSGGVTVRATKLASRHKKIVKSKKPIPEEYIVVLKDEVPEWEVEWRADLMAAEHGGKIHHYYQHALKGFSIRMSAEAALALSQHPLVDFVEEEEEGLPSGTQSPAPSWGLDRIDQANLPLNNSYTVYESGAGVHAFVIDTGINPNHQDLLNRIGIANSKDFFEPANSGKVVKDCFGHGTAVASVLGGRTYGVAKGVTLHSVRIAGCDGKAIKDNKILGLNYVASTTLRPAVANYSWNNSLGFDSDSAIKKAAVGVVSKGITLVNSAGNDGIDAAYSSPTYAPEILVAGATDMTDTRSVWYWGSSNYGAPVDVFAPGSNITAADHNTTSGSKSVDGTSFAAPHVAGAVALYLEKYPSATPAQVESYIKNNSSTGKVKNVPAGTTQTLLRAGVIRVITSP